MILAEESMGYRRHSCTLEEHCLSLAVALRSLFFFVALVLRDGIVAFGTQFRPQIIINYIGGDIWYGLVGCHNKMSSGTQPLS